MKAQVHSTSNNVLCGEHVKNNAMEKTHFILKACSQDFQKSLVWFLKSCMHLTDVSVITVQCVFLNEKHSMRENTIVIDSCWEFQEQGRNLNWYLLKSCGVDSFSCPLHLHGGRSGKTPSLLMSSLYAWYDRFLFVFYLLQLCDWQVLYAVIYLSW